jgi:predicted phage terminase large subunit-like protein
MGAFSCEDTGKKKSKKVKNRNKKILPGFENWNDRLPECVVLCEAVAAYGTDSLSVAKDYFDALRGLAQDNSAESYEEELAYMVAKGKEFFDVVNRMLARSAAAKTSAAPEWYELKRKVCLLLAPHSFDHYMQYVEWNREPSRKFWLPRRKILLRICNDLQDLEEHKIRFLGVSLPARTGKSTLCILFLTWHMGRHPDESSAMGGHSDTLVNGFYGELNAVLDPDGEYLWHDVFPHAQIESRSAKYLQINLNHPKRFPTMTCRSAEGTWTGAIDISRDGILYVDDLVKDLEESLSPSRLDAKYNIYLNQMKDRMKDGALQLMVGTRWNVMDPLGRVREQYRDNPDYRFTVIPALDANGESNFQYDYGVGFSTEYYRDMKASIDDCTWCAKYQGAPYIRQGLVFPPDSLLRYNGILPGGQPDRIIAACDVAWGGDDYLAMPIVYIYGDGSMYCVDVVFSNANKTFTQPAVVGKLLIHRPHQVQFEANNGGTEYAQAVDKMLREKGCVLNISTRRAPGNAPKLSRIIQYAPDILKIHFLDFDHSTPEYRSFIEWLCSFVSLGKNVHDDAPDSLAQLMDLATGNWGIVSVQKRVF